MNNAEQGLEEWVIPVGAVETMVAVGPGDDKSDRVELSQLVLDRVKGETTHVHQFAHVAMLLWFREKQPQKLGSHSGKQDIKNRLFRTQRGFVNLTALSRQVSLRAGPDDAFLKFLSSEDGVDVEAISGKAIHKNTPRGRFRAQSPVPAPQYFVLVLIMQSGKKRSKRFARDKRQGAFLPLTS